MMRANVKSDVFVLLCALVAVLLATACGSEKKTDAPKEAEVKVEAEVAAPEAPAAEKEEAGEPAAQIANPWTESDREGVQQATGFDIAVPDEATDASYSYSVDGMAQLRYVYKGSDWTYRIQKTDKLTDISGMYYDWVVQEPGKVGDMDAEYFAYSDATEDTEFIDDVFAVHVVNWYDTGEGATHSLSAAGKTLDGMDIQAIAEGM